MLSLLRSVVTDIGLGQLEKDKEKLFHIYLRELQIWNKKFNLTAYESEREIVIYHFIDSLLPLPFFPIKEGNLIDIGSGAGLPGIPLKIFNPSFSLHLLEANKKRILFLKHIREKLKMDFEILEGRAEDLGRNPQYRERFSLAVARAVAPLPVLLEYSLPFLKVGGFFIAYKGPKLEEELKESRRALSILGGKVLDVKGTILPFVEEKRMFLFVFKERETPENYPRRAGIPAKRPL
ncbi:16S rRNA (guanine(527)-N(7))-methyltransferase RsmG [bacterium]|nr:16S rRNA (guanine(527)-N(7))-methyltransferase RsmG [bacterium]